MNTELGQPATIAGRAKIAQAVVWDAVAWIAPWTVFGLLLLVPPIGRSPVWVGLGLVVTVIWSSVELAIDVRWLKRYGYTDGLQKYNLRVIDPVDDQILFKARLYEKSILKLLLGKYVVLDLGTRPD